MSSNALPFVSEANLITNSNDSRANPPYRPYARARDTSFSPGNVTVMIQLATHWPPAASESAAARIRLGNISPSSTQTAGPQDIPNAITNTLAAISAIGP